MTTTATSTASASAALSDAPTWRTRIGTLLVRGIVPAWLVAGALFKLSDLNPNVLPPPVREAVFWVQDWVPVERGEWLLTSMRLMIAVELVLVGVMLLVPKLARSAAIFILAVFCTVLLFELADEVRGSAFQKNGFAALLKPCGCFGAWSPPTIVTFMIDLVLLVGCIACPQSARARAVPSSSGALAALLASLVIGPAVAFARPGKVIEPTPPAPDGVDVATVPNDPAPPDAGTNGGAGNAATPPTAGSAKPWPAYPAKLAPNYYIAEKKAIGTAFDAQPLAALLAKSVPADFRTGRRTVIFYRSTCDHCFELMNSHFAGDLATPTYSIQVPDNAGGKQHPNPCKACVNWELPSGPDYIIQTPLVMTIVDGTIAAICKDAEKPGALEATLKAWSAGHEKDAAVDGMLLAPMPQATGDGSAAPPAKPASKPFPPMPKLESVYAPETSTWQGKRLDELDLPLIINRPIPIDITTGDVIVMFYRADCEHCESVILEHFSGDLPCPTLLVAIPDADGEPFQNPCTECKKTSLPKGPTYVVETPILVVAKDGVVQHVFAGQETESIDEVKAALPKPKAK